MKKITVLSLFLLGEFTLAYADIIDYTGVDVQTETVKIVDETTRPTGLVLGLGLGLQNVGFPSVDYKISMTNFDLNFACWQATPQIQWNVVGMQFGTTKDNGSRFDIFTQLTYFLSPLKSGSYFATAKFGYSSYETESRESGFYSGIDGVLLGLGGGYSWPWIKLEGGIDFFSTYSDKHRSSSSHDYSGNNPSFYIKATVFYILKDNGSGIRTLLNNSLSGQTVMSLFDTMLQPAAPNR